MKRFHYRLPHREGVILAESREAAEAMLARRGLTALAIWEEGEPRPKAVAEEPPSEPVRAAPGKRWEWPRLGRPGLSLMSQTLLWRHLAVLFEAGIALHTCLEVLARNQPDPRGRRCLEDLTLRITRGERLTAALSHHPSLAQPVITGLLSAGEASGQLHMCLERSADYLEKQLWLRKRVQAALAYPTVVLVGSLLLVLFFCQITVPAFEQMLISLKVEIPWPTRLLFALQGFLGGPWSLGILAALAALAGLFAVDYLRSPEGRRELDRHVLRLPLVGKLLHQQALANFAWGLGVMSGVGVNADTALRTAIATCGNSEVAQRLSRVPDRLATGDTIAQALASSGQFPAFFLGLVGTGEETGKLGPMLVRARQILEEDIHFRIEVLAHAIEPLIMGVLGLTVLGLFLLLFFPVYTAVSQML